MVSVVQCPEAWCEGLLCVSMTIPQGSDLHRECLGYREKMRAALAAYQVS